MDTNGHYKDADGHQVKARKSKKLSLTSWKRMADGQNKDDVITRSHERLMKCKNTLSIWVEGCHFHGCKDCPYGEAGKRGFHKNMKII